MSVQLPVGVVVVTHGHLSVEFVNAAEAIVGDLSGIEAVSIGWHDDVSLAHELIAQAVSKVDAGGGVLLLTDMFGGTPSNLAIAFLDAGRIEVVTGVSLPMLIKIAKAPAASDLLALARDLREHGREAIRVASDLLRNHPPEREA